ncbi:MAG TPA: Dam family site-specific DNA-(adenine-N6)-methyltransferase [Candidatus Binatia bacterium]|nr:Dam family site-specific DNA-(adenine-N6)-methyltransferase [Candidatus Binatia bacterium]
MSETETPLPLAVPLSPPLKWAGGKRWLVPQLIPLWQPFSERRLVEPFCGALAITLGLVPERALLNDANPHVMHFYGWLKRGMQITLWMENDRELYYAHRKRFNELLREGKADCAEAAALFYYLNRTCFNGLCRFNASGEFNVPFGRYKSINYIRDFSAYQQVFSNWEFTSVDFENTRLEADDFIYADPPFDVEFTRYAKEPFGWEDQVRAAEWLARHKGPVILSNQATERILTLYEKLGFKLRFLDGPRRISCTGDRKPAREVLAARNF